MRSSGGMTVAPVREGDVLAGKYRVDRVLGVGGMGVVVAATHLQLDQKVALKFMLPEAFANPEALARFQREARAAVRLKSEHVARVSDTGTFDNGSPYIVMEYLEGGDLAAEIQRQGPMPVPVVAEFIVQACDALAEAHAQGIIHRDLKPANLFVTRRADQSPLVKVLDFGISKANSLTESGLGMTKTASMMGSPLYMSPEQMKSAKDVDMRTDVWSMGVVMYEMLSGHVPFNSDTLGGLLAKVMTEPLPPLEQVRRDLPPPLALLVNHCLEKDPARRCASVAELAQGLRPFCPPRSQPIVERISGVLGRPSQLPAQPNAFRQTAPLGVSTGPVVAHTSGDWGASPKTSSSKVIAIVAAAVSLAIVAGVVIMIAVKGHGPATDTQATPDHTATPTATATATATAAATVTASAAASATATATVTAATPTMTASASPTPHATTNAHATIVKTATSAPATTGAPTTTGKKPGLLDDSM